ncbi:hypothetical protein ACL02S_22685 [Nocardia sp. 004]|uniref:hypothetical protein n=1 Tax=Nocardia sp. 004 TaxID=3385978 RepID=UPI00399F967E
MTDYEIRIPPLRYKYTGDLGALGTITLLSITLLIALGYLLTITTIVMWLLSITP